MERLRLNWINDGSPVTPASLADGVEIKTFAELENGLSMWVDIVKYMGKDEVLQIEDASLHFKEQMISKPNFNESLCFIVTINQKPAATISVACDYKEKDGLVYMVCCKPEYRGMGLGKLIIKIAIDALKTEGMKTGHIFTDDWRKPAIKLYLKAGFVPDTESKSDYKARWDRIFEEMK